MKILDGPDSFDSALTYTDGVIRDAGIASTQEQRCVFLVDGSRMIEFLQRIGPKWHHTTGYPQYHQQPPGASSSRASDPDFQYPETGEVESLSRRAGMTNAPMYACEATKLVLAKRHCQPFMLPAKMAGLRSIGWARSDYNGENASDTIVEAQSRSRYLGTRGIALVKLIVEHSAVVGAIVTPQSTAEHDFPFFSALNRQSSRFTNRLYSITTLYRSHGSSPSPTLTHAAPLTSALADEAGIGTAHFGPTTPDHRKRMSR